MKLGEIVRLIPKNVEFYVEVYKASDETEMIYAYWVRSFDDEERDNLNTESDREVIEIRPSDSRHGRPALSIAIRDERY